MSDTAERDDTRMTVEVTISRSELAPLAEWYFNRAGICVHSYDFSQSSGWSASGIRDMRDELVAHLTRAADLLEGATQSDVATFGDAFKAQDRAGDD